MTVGAWGRASSRFRDLLRSAGDRVAVLGAGGGGGGGLIVRLDAIGDFLLWLPAAKALRGRAGGGRVVLLANQSWADLARSLPYWDEVWPVDVKRFRAVGPYRWALLRRLRAAGFGTALQPAFSRDYSSGDAAIWASGAAARWGWEGDLSNITAARKARSDRWYTDLAPAGDPPRMELLRNLAFNRALGAPEPDGPYSLPTVAALPAGLAPSGPYALFAPGAGSPLRQWPLGHFAAVADRLSAERGWRTVICGAPGEAAVCAGMAGACARPALDLCGRTSLPQLAELVRGARVVVGNESAPVHLAATVGTPSVCILGAGHFGRFMPYPEGLALARPEAVHRELECSHCNWACDRPHEPDGPAPCVGGVGLADVRSALERVLAHPAE